MRAILEAKFMRKDKENVEIGIISYKLLVSNGDILNLPLKRLKKFAPDLMPPFFPPVPNFYKL